MKPPHISVAFSFLPDSVTWEYAWYDSGDGNSKQVYEGKYPRYVFRVEGFKGDWLIIHQLDFYGRTF
jgi:hypothetical protein